MPNAADSLTIAERVVLLARGSDQAQATVSSSRAAYSRFARNYVTQNLSADSTTVTLTYVRNGHLGTATTGDISQSGLQRLVASAADIAKRVPKNREFVSLAKRAPIAKAIKSIYASTRNATPDDRVNKLLPVFARMKQSNLSSAGFTTTQTSVTAVANSLGVRVAFEGTYGGMEIKAMAANTSGFAEYFSRDYASLDSAERAQRAAAKATVSATPEDFAPGTYTVILEPPAFVDCLNNVLSGMNIGSVLEEKDSWMVGRIGQPIFSRNLSIVDDWSHPLNANQPFADDGAPTQKVTLVRDGVPLHYVSSTYLANKFKAPNTGHSNGYPTNAVVMPGTKSREQLISETERGILISRTWYTREVDPREATITGLTRDGVFLIENGKLTKTLKNFRFFTSMLSALKDMEVGNKLYLAESADTAGTLAVPDAKLMKFTLSAQASFA